MNLTDLVQRLINQTLRELRVSMPARVVGYDAGRQIVSVDVVQPEVMPDGEIIAQPVIVEVPVSWPRAGGAHLTFPIARGDTGLIVFADRDIGAWVSEGFEGRPDSKRTHSLTDAVFIPGIQGGGVSANANDVELQYNGSTIHIRQNGQVEVNAPNVVVNANQTTVNSTTDNNGNVTINGNASVNGNISCTGTITAPSMVASTGVSIAGINFGTHTHGGVQTGPNSTGGPQ